ncbi:MAG: MerC domain-containing protein [Rhodospirillaceae bacterium]|nr:MerC domain-containing protein [Rhodospirillaceae bacterium]
MAAGNGIWRWSPAARLDLYAVGLSTLCVLHCIALPLFVSLMPVLALAAESEVVHRLLVVAAVPVSLRVIWRAWPVRGNKLFVAAAVVGLVLLLLAAFVEAAAPYEEPITVTGGALLGSAHLWHWVRTCSRGGSHSLPAETGEA